MTQQDLINRLTTAVMRDDLAGQYPNFINEALREIQRKRSWRYMLTIEDFVVPAGSTSVALPSNFKELSNTRSPVHLWGNSIEPTLPNLLTPCEVWTRERIIRQQGRVLGLSVLTPVRWQQLSIPVYIDWSGESPSLNIYVPQGAPFQSFTFNVKYFQYIPDLVNPTDANGLTNEYPEMVVAKCKSIAFESINDPAAADAENLFMIRFKEAAANDAHASIIGMDLRM